MPLPTEWNLTECVIDGFQAVGVGDGNQPIEVMESSAEAGTYLGTAVIELYNAIEIEGSRCPDDSPAGCAVA